MVFRAISKHASKFQRRWFGPYRMQYYLPNNIFSLVTINKVDPNLVLFNINKLKPYRFIKDRTLQFVLTKPSDLVTDETIQTQEPQPLHVELEDFPRNPRNEIKSFLETNHLKNPKKKLSVALKDGGQSFSICN